MSRRLPAVLLVLASPAVFAQQRTSPMNIPGWNVPKEPAQLTPAATDFKDLKYHLRIHVPAGWNFARKDGVVSTLETDIRSASPGLQVRAAASINYNPYPPTTFSGALFYYSVLPKSDADTCSAMATTGHLKAIGPTQIANRTFAHGRDEHGNGCIESRNDVFTTQQGNACLRFDLVINTYCASNSGAQEIQQQQLADIQKRLANILGSLQFDAK